LVFVDICVAFRALLLILSFVVDSIKGMSVTTFGALFGLRVEQSSARETPESATFAIDVLAATYFLSPAFALGTLLEPLLFGIFDHCFIICVVGFSLA
jgi:hypothetical protein